jgi:hypothetical protein
MHMGITATSTYGGSVLFKEYIQSSVMKRISRVMVGDIERINEKSDMGEEE